MQAARYLKRRVPQFPRVGVVLGSGIDALTSRIADAETVPYWRIPHFSRPAVAGHSGKLHFGRLKRLPVAVLAGRVHLYEGYTPAEVGFAVRVLGLAGVQTVILTCAAGGISSSAATGSLMAFSDHLNFQGSSPLTGPHDPRWGARFGDMSDAYDPRLRRAVVKAGRSLGVKCFEGVYSAMPGPQYETPAEIRALKRLGADAVGMSTVPEVIAARQLKMRVLALALITNRAAGLAGRPLAHDEVLTAGACGALDIARLLERVVPALAG